MVPAYSVRTRCFHIQNVCILPTKWIWVFNKEWLFR